MLVTCAGDCKPPPDECSEGARRSVRGPPGGPFPGCPAGSSQGPRRTVRSLCGGAVGGLARCAPVPVGMAGKVGNWSLRTDARWAMIVFDGARTRDTRAPPGRDPDLSRRPEPRRHRAAGGLHGRRRAISHLARDEGAARRDAAPPPATRSRSSAATRRRAPPAAWRSCPSAALEASPAELDTLIVPGGSGHRRAADDEELVRWIARTAPHRQAHGLGLHRRLPAGRAPDCSTGAARPPTGPSRRSSREPTRRSRSTPTRSSSATATIWTSAGVTAGMDLALALVEEDHDRELALTIARHLVLFLRRPGKPVAVQRDAQLPGARARAAAEIQRSVIEDAPVSTRSRRWPRGPT